MSLKEILASGSSKNKDWYGTNKLLFLCLEPAAPNDFLLSKVKNFDLRQYNYIIFIHCFTIRVTSYTKVWKWFLSSTKQNQTRKNPAKNIFHDTWSLKMSFPPKMILSKSWLNYLSWRPSWFPCVFLGHINHNRSWISHTGAAKGIII